MISTSKIRRWAEYSKPCLLSHRNDQNMEPCQHRHFLYQLPIHKRWRRDGDLSCSWGIKAHTGLYLWFTSGITCMTTRIRQNIKTTFRRQSSKTDALSLHPQNPYLKYMPRGSNLFWDYTNASLLIDLKYLPTLQLLTRQIWVYYRWVLPGQPKLNRETPSRKQNNCKKCKTKQKTTKKLRIVCVALTQWFSTILILCLFTTVLHVVVTPPIKSFTCYFISVILLLLLS